MLINPFKPDYDQKTVFDGPASNLHREVDKGFKLAAKKYGWPSDDFRSRVNAGFREALAYRNRPKAAKDLDFIAKIDEDFPVEFE